MHFPIMQALLHPCQVPGVIYQNINIPAAWFPIRLHNSYHIGNQLHPHVYTQSLTLSEDSKAERLGEGPEADGIPIIDCPTGQYTRVPLSAYQNRFTSMSILYYFKRTPGTQ